MKPISSLVQKMLGPIAKKQGFFTGKIILEWPQIVGDKFCQWCKPEKVYFKKGQRRHGTLYLIANPSHALLLQHSEQMIIEKINTYFGYEAVTSIRIRQEPFVPKETRYPQSITVKKAHQNSLNPSQKVERNPEKRLENALDELNKLIKKDVQAKGAQKNQN